MEYQKIINLLDNKPNQPSKFWGEELGWNNDDSGRMYNTNSQIKIYTSMLKSNWCNYSGAYILAPGRKTVVGARATKAVWWTDRNNKQAIIQNCVPFTKWMTEIHNVQADNVKDLDVVMPIYNLIEYGDNYSKGSGSFYQFCRDEIEDIIADSESFKSKSRFFNNINNGIIDAEIAVPLKYLSKFWRTPLINSEINLTQTWSEKCDISEKNKATTFAITDTQLHVPVVT